VSAVLQCPDSIALRPRAQMSRLANPRAPTATVFSPTNSPVATNTAAIVCERLWVSAPSTIILSRPPLHLDWVDTRRTRLAGGGATLLSSHAEHPRPATSDKAKGSHAHRPTASMRVSSPPGRDHLQRVGRHRPPESKQQASMQQRRRGVCEDSALAGMRHSTDPRREASARPSRAASGFAEDCCRSRGGGSRSRV
jgi:hypothetical protein